MRANSKITAPLQRRAHSLKAQIGAISARQVLEWLAANLLRSLRLSRDQICGGRGIIKREGVYYVPLWLPIALALLLASSPLLGR